MRMLAAALCLCALTGCGDRRTFDERYNDARAEVEQRARALDQNLVDEPAGNEAGVNSAS